MKMANTASSDKLAEVNRLREKLQWIQPDENDYPISEFERFKQRMIRNPFVPLGFIGTVTALTLGLRSLLKGNTRQSQQMMRWRVGLQGATIAVLVAGVYVHSFLADRKKED